MTFTRKIILVLLTIATIAPATVSAQGAGDGFSRQGIFGCGRNAAALSGSVGAFSATGGVFAPVADYTVELNTGTLVYLECVLRGIVNRESEAATAADVSRRLRFLAEGRGGNPMFSVNGTQERRENQDDNHLDSLQNDGLLQAMHGSFRDNVRRAAARNYMGETRNETLELNCADDGSGSTGLAAIVPLRNPACYEIGAYYIYEEILNRRDTEYLRNIDNELDWGRGFYCVSRIEEGERICDTPSVYVEETGLQAITSGFRRVENANNIDQMIGALYAGLGTQALTGSGGLRVGLTTAIGSGASYLSRLTTESNLGLRNAAANAALGILAAARGVEVQYNQVVSAIANTLTNAIGQLRSMERQCFDLIIYNTQPAPAKHVCAAPPVDGRCTGVSGAQLTISTSTRGFAQAIIDAQIAPIATQAVTNVQRSQTALGLIDQLIQGVSNTQSLDAQRLALVQLDQLVTQGRLHVAADVTSVQQQQSAVADAMSQLVTQTRTLWADDPDPTRGWCNVANQAVIDFWDSQWR